MEKKVMAVCITVGFLGLLATALGFAAEAKRIKRSQMRNTPSESCIYPRSPALALGLTAALALTISQTIINVVTGCLCCRRGPYQSNYSWTLALACSVVSWFTFVIAVLVLLIGAALNDEPGDGPMYYGPYGNYYCYVVKPGVFAAAAILSLSTVVLGILSYVTMESAKNRGDPWARPVTPGQTGIAMGQPRSQDPVFVHEDTYIRRQLA